MRPEHIDPRVRGALGSLVVVLATNALVAIAPHPQTVGAPRHAVIPVDPPGWFVGLVWTLLFLGLGATWGAAAIRHDRRGKELVLGLIVIAALYPLYTLNLSDARIGLAGNLLTALVAAITGARTRAYGAFGVAPFVVVAWLLFASATLIPRPGS